MRYGILRSNVNTGSDDEVALTFAAPISLESNQPAFVSDTMSLRRMVSSQNAQRWEIETGLVPENTTSTFLVHSVISGYTQVFFARPPQVYRGDREPLLDDATTVTVSAASLASSGEIFIQDIGPEVLEAGELINIGSDTKTYVVTEGGSSGSIKIFPKLRKDASIGDTIWHGGKATMRVRFETNTVLGMHYVDGVVNGVDSIRLIEALS